MMWKICALNCWRMAGVPVLYNIMVSFCMRRAGKSRRLAISWDWGVMHSKEGRHYPITIGMNSSARHLLQAGRVKSKVVTYIMPLALR